MQCVMGRRGGGGVDPTPYVWMSEGKLLMGLIMDDTIRGTRGRGGGYRCENDVGATRPRL